MFKLCLGPKLKGSLLQCDLCKEVFFVTSPSAKQGFSLACKIGHFYSFQCFIFHLLNLYIVDCCNGICIIYIFILFSYAKCINWYE